MSAIPLLKSTALLQSPPNRRLTAFVLRHTSRHLNTEFAGFCMNWAPLWSIFQIDTMGNNRGTNMINERYFAELSDSEDGQPIYFDNEVIDASNDQEAIGKADKWAARHKLGVVAMLIVRQGVREV